MPRFDAFRALRYAPSFDRAQVTAPPYDVIDDDERAALADRSPVNAVHVDLPAAPTSDDPYQHAAHLLARWRADGVLVEDRDPTFTVYRMTFTDETGRVRRTTGVLGALELWEPDAGHILPHEHTTPKAKSDRLDLLRATRANLSAIWGLSPARGLTELLPTDSKPEAEWTDPEGVTHTVWVCDDEDRIKRISDAIAAHPVVVADGHHRYETSLQYRDERRAAGNAVEAVGATLCYVVELVEDELTVQPIHRLLSGLPSGTDLVADLKTYFTVQPTDDFGPDAVERLVEAGGMGLCTASGTFVLVPRPGAFSADVELDTVRLEVARAHLAPHDLTYQHGVGNVVAAVRAGRADAAILVRPATVGQIQAIAHGGDRMPPKTTFFAPKPATGVVFRAMSTSTD